MNIFCRCNFDHSLGCKSKNLFRSDLLKTISLESKRLDSKVSTKELLRQRPIGISNLYALENVSRPKGVEKHGLIEWGEIAKSHKRYSIPRWNWLKALADFSSR